MFIVVLELMRLLLFFAAIPFLIAQTPPKRVFTHSDGTTVTIIADHGFMPLLQLGPETFDEKLKRGEAGRADTAIVDIFFEYYSTAFKGEDGGPTRLLLSVRATCPVIIAPYASGCDYVAREGLTLDSIQFVRVKFLKTVREIDRISPEETGRMTPR